MTNDYSYRVLHGETASYKGIIKKDPVDKDIITVAAFTGNSIYHDHGGDIPKTDIVNNIKKIEPDHINDPNYDPATVDVPESKLLGERQLLFLREWGKNWQDCEMKTVLSQIIFCGGAL